MYLEKFIRNLLLNKNNELKNRYLHVGNISERKNVAIDNQNIAIDDKNMAIETRITEIKFNVQTITNIKKIYEEYGTESIFGRGDIAKTCNISYSAAGNLISKMRMNGLVDDVKGCGKGKYRFR